MLKSSLIEGRNVLLRADLDVSVREGGLKTTTASKLYYLRSNCAWKMPGVPS